MMGIRSPSLPSRGAWIEIIYWKWTGVGAKSLPSRGAWIEINLPLYPLPTGLRRSPHGERGLK